MTAKKPSLIARAARWTAALLGACVAATTPVAAQSVAPAQAPAEWIAYAEAATASVTALLQADSEPAVRLRAYLDATRSAPDQPTAPLVLKIWVDANGAVSRIDYPPFAHAQANADLRGLIVGAALPGAPPKDMLLPMRIAVQLDARPTQPLPPGSV
ncbi:MAG: hypothetical protein WCZ66_03300 [Sphingomonadaceae bacterium]